MSTSAHAVLFYGYGLGCPSSEGWQVKEALDGRFAPPWISLDPAPGRAMALALLAAAGVAANQVKGPKRGGWWQELLARHCGVEVVSHGPRAAPRYSLAVADSVSWTSGWDARYISPTLGGEAHRRLNDALAVLGITPLQANPSWMLVTTEM